MSQVHPGTQQLMSLHVPPTDLQKCLDRVDYLGSRGLSGLGALKNYIQRHKRKAAKATNPTEELAWFKMAPLHGAVMNGHVSTTLSWIYEEMSCSLDTVNKEGNTALHHAVIWGRNACVVWLLDRGCDGTVRNNVEQTALQMAIARQAKLNDPNLQSDRVGILDRDKLLREGLDLVNILQGVHDSQHNYKHWAKHNPHHALVVEYSPWSMFMDNRVQLTLLRNLTINGRATQLTREELMERRAIELNRVEQEQYDSEQKINSNKPKVVYPDLKEAMVKDLGSLDLWIGLSAMGCKQYTDLRTIEREMVGRCENLDARERRQLWLWIKEQKEGVLSSDVSSGSGGERQRRDPMANMSKTAIKKYKAELRRIDVDESERRIGLTISFKSKLPDDAFREMMGFLY